MRRRDPVRIRPDATRSTGYLRGGLTRKFQAFRSHRNAVLGCALHARTADTNPGCTAPRRAPARRPARFGRGRGRRQAPAHGRTLRARRGTPARHFADAAAPHGGPALPAVAPFTRPGGRRLWLSVVGRVPAAGRPETKAACEAAKAGAGHKVRVTFARPAGRSGSRQARRVALRVDRLLDRLG